MDLPILFTSGLEPFRRAHTPAVLTDTKFPMAALYMSDSFYRPKYWSDEMDEAPWTG